MEVKKYFADYTAFIDSVTSEVSRSDEIFTERFHKLSQDLNGNYSRLDNAIAGLAGESGEVADVWKKVKYHNLDYTPEVKDRFIKELGDVCWYLFQTAFALGVPMDEIIGRNIEKLKERHPHGFSSVYLKDKKD
ncbi:MAG: nucleoside triphosphate pyrophosphohydrolase family protein [Alphaproteobacteria bacterium]|nr:nucleoside triphosphate pyrophosphohydrolase family protein [Alphaproteobacteria bacterium]